MRIAILHGRQTPHEQNEVTQFTGEQIILADECSRDFHHASMC